MVVVLTAPRPTRRTPSLPRAGAISTGVDTKKNYIIIDCMIPFETCATDPYSARRRNDRREDAAIGSVQIGCAHGGRLGAVAGKVGLSGRFVAVVAGRRIRRASDEGCVAGRARWSKSRVASLSQPAVRGQKPSTSRSSMTPAACLRASRPPIARRWPRRRSASCAPAAACWWSVRSRARPRRPARPSAERPALDPSRCSPPRASRPPRVLAEREGLIFVEAVKPR